MLWSLAVVVALVALPLGHHPQVVVVVAVAGHIPAFPCLALHREHRLFTLALGLEVQGQPLVAALAHQVVRLG